ncbi:hypothetical protein MCEMSHM24_00740 [Comamonadaceae bacterium]
MVKNRSVEMYALTVPLEAVKKLSNEQRFAYYMLGHMFNELMCLQKLVSFSLPKHDDRRPARLRPELGQAMFLFRLASGKIWEAGKAIRERKQLAVTLHQDVLPRMPNGKQRLKDLNAAINAAQWLSPLRNGIGFHFPTFEHWSRHIIPDESWVDDTVFLSSQSGNTYYDAADTLAQAFMFQQYGVTNLKEAIDPLIGQMIDLLGTTNSFLEDALGIFISEVILDGSVTREPAGTVLAPIFENVSTPFWTAMPAKHPLQ